MKRFVLAIGILVLAALACGDTGSAPDASAISTSAVATAMASIPTTAVPTNTPLPTSTPAATATSTTQTEERAYVLELQARFADYQDAYLKVNDQIQMIPEEPALILDPDWKAKTHANLTLLDVAGDQLENVPNIPTKFAHIDQLMDAIASETHEMVKNMKYGIDHVNSDAITAAATNISTITELMVQATTEMQAIQQ